MPEELRLYILFTRITSYNVCYTKLLRESSKKDRVSVKSSSSKKNHTAKTGIAYEIVDKAMDYEGVRYRTGGTTSSGMDCSGLVYTTFKSFDISVPRTSGSLALQGKKVSKNRALPGDLIFFKTNGKKSIIV